MAIQLLFFPDIAVSTALQFDINRIEIHSDGRVSAHAILRYVPEESPLGMFCPPVVEFPSWGEPWSLFNQQSCMKVSGIPTSFKGDNRIHFCLFTEPSGFSMKTGDEVSGVFDLTYRFKHPLDRDKLLSDDSIKVKVSSRLAFYSNNPIAYYTTSFGYTHRSKIEIGVHSQSVPLSLPTND